MNLIKYDPFRELRGLQDEMNRLFGSTLSRSSSDEATFGGGWSPRVDIYENKDNLVIEAELPGMNPENVDISIENNVLTIQGKREFEQKDESDNFHRVERHYGSFTRSFTLPSTVNSEDATANFENGVLKLSLAKREEAKPRRIEIKADGGSKKMKTIEMESKSEKASA
jgi:HSP20 family protein